MSFIFSQALVEVSLLDKCSGIDASALSSGSHMPPLFLSSDKTTAFSRLSRFGMTFGHLTDDLGAALLMWSLADSRARTSVLPGKEQASPESDPACGPTWRASLAKFAPASCSWKTPQLSLLGDSELSSVTWPRSGMTQGGQCWELPMLGRRTSVTGYGSSQEAWPTPRCQMTRPVRVRADVDKGHQSNLEEVVAVRATWPTPTVCGNYNRKGASATSRDGLATAVYQTPVARMWKDNGQNPSELERNSPTLAMQAGGLLSPTWVEWLMGWPLGWTDLKPSETVKSHCVQQLHSECL